MKGIEKIRLFKVYSALAGGRVFETHYVDPRHREEGEDRTYDVLVSDTPRVEDHIIEEASREELLSLFEARSEDLASQVKKAREAFPDLQIEAPEARVDLDAITTYKEVVRYGIEPEDRVLRRPQYVLVYKGIRGQYVSGAPGYFLCESGAPEMESHRACDESRFAMELVEDYLREEGLLDERYTI